MIHSAQASLFALAQVALGIITIFGRKGKKDGKDEEKTGKAPAGEQQLVAQPPQPSPSTQPSPASENPSSDGEIQNSSESVTHPGETSLNELLRSLLQDVPLTTTIDDAQEQSNEGSSEWVPPTPGPRSRAMVIEREAEEDTATLQPDQPSLSGKPLRLTPPTVREQVGRDQAQPTRPAIPSASKAPSTGQEGGKSPKAEKPEKPESKQSTPVPASKTPLGFEHLLDLTKGGLESPGLVLVAGQQGTGKTSLALNLAGKYLSTGNDCILVCYDQAVPSLRDRIKSTGWEAGQYESGFRLMIFDAFSCQTDPFSTEPYYMEKPFDLDSVTETLTRNLQMMMSNKIRVIIDSLTILLSKNTPKEFLAKFRGLSDKMRELGSTFIVTVDLSKISKEAVAGLEDMATCEIELQKDGQKPGQLKVKKLNGSLSKLEPEEFEIEQGKGLLFT